MKTKDDSPTFADHWRTFIDHCGGESVMSYVGYYLYRKHWHLEVKGLSIVNETKSGVSKLRRFKDVL